MIKYVLNQFNAAVFAEIALIIFALAFLAVVVKTLLTKPEITDEQAKIVLGDQQEN